MICPHCQQPIDPALIIAERQSQIASRKRPGSKGLIRNRKGNPNLSNPWGRAGKPTTSAHPPKP